MRLPVDEEEEEDELLWFIIVCSVEKMQRQQPVSLQ